MNATKTHPVTTECMTDYLTRLKGCGVKVDDHTWFYQIGRSVYVAGRYVNASGDWSLVLKPVYRTDWVTTTSAGPYPSLLPAAYKRAPNRSVFVAPDMNVYYIAGYSDAEQNLWLHPYRQWDDDPKPQRIMMH